LGLSYKSNATETGKIVLVPDRVVPKTTVTINDSLIVYKKFVKTVTINNVPVGYHDIHFVSDSRWYKKNLDFSSKNRVDKDKTKTMLIGVSPYSNGFWAYQGILYMTIMSLWFLAL